MKVSCPNCGQFYEVEEKFTGLNVGCPSCGKSFKIPALEQTKRCPMCGEEILAVAKKCKHCGEYLDAAYRKNTGHGSRQSVDRASYTLAGLFLGSIGIHNFMDGNKHSGVGKIIAVAFALFFLIGWGEQGTPGALLIFSYITIWIIIDLIKGPKKTS